MSDACPPKQTSEHSSSRHNRLLPPPPTLQQSSDAQSRRQTEMGGSSIAKRKLLVAVLVLCCIIQAAAVSEERERLRREKEEEEEWRTGKRQREEEEEEKEVKFLMRGGKRVVSTEAGEMRVVKGYGGRLLMEKPLHIGFITMEPKSLLIPQYLDSTLILFLRRGEAKMGLIYKDELAERWLREGDVYLIPAGSTFYIVNTGEGQRLHIICSIDPSRGLGFDIFQSFFVAGGTNPTSVLAGFDPQTLSIAFNVTLEELEEIMRQQDAGAIVYTDGRGPRIWSNFHELKQEERLQHLKRKVPMEEEEEVQNKEEVEEQEQQKWSLRTVLKSLLFGLEDDKKKRRERHDERRGRRAGPDTYNLYKTSPDFQNKYGYSIAVDHHDFHQLKKPRTGLFYVNLSAGTMMAPHLNPTATEYGIVLTGSGTIQIVYPNGTSALKAKVKEGDVFWVPRYFPFCQIASRSGPFEFFGFTHFLPPEQATVLGRSKLYSEDHVGSRVSHGIRGHHGETQGDRWCPT
ncbi:hypothetical protein Ancab_012931 [Ancistrocladus abbreviatus]